MNFNFLNTEELLFRPRAERERILFDLVKAGRLDMRVCNMLLAELDMREEAMKEDEEQVTAMMKRTPKRTVVIREKNTCRACHGIGMRNVCISTTFRMGNYRRADGSYHLEQDGTECEQQYEWKTCPDCNGTGKDLLAGL